MRPPCFRRIRHHRFSAVRLCLLVAVTVMLGACLPQFPDTAKLSPVNNSPEADETWERFATIADRAEKTATPFRASGTLYYSGKEDSQRVSFYLWGNGEQKSLLPLRLDIMMGHGNVLARAKESAEGFRVFVPAEETLYTHENGSNGLLAFGMPFPFSLSELAALVTGRFGMAFGTPGRSLHHNAPQAYEGTGATYIYDIDHAPMMPGYLQLSPRGLPLSWREDDVNGWKLTIEYWPDSTRTTPRKLHIRHGAGNEATLIIREVATTDAFAPDQMELAVPADTQTVSLDPAKAKAAAQAAAKADAQKSKKKKRTGK